MCEGADANSEPGSSLMCESSSVVMDDWASIGVPGVRYVVGSLDSVGSSCGASELYCAGLAEEVEDGKCYSVVDSGLTDLPLCVGW